MSLFPNQAKALTAAVALGVAAQWSAGADSLDISSAFNFDAIATQAEFDQANTHDDGVAGTGVNHSVLDIFAPTGTPTVFRGQDHYFVNQYSQHSYFQDLDAGTGVAATVTSPYATYTLAPGSTTDNVAAEIGTGNALRLGTKRGGNETQVGTGIVSETINFEPAQQANYSDINLLFTGTQSDRSQTAYGATHSRKHAWVNIYANYGDASSDLVWTSPKSDTWEGNDNYAAYGDDRDNIPGGLPGAYGYVQATGYLEQAYKDAFNQVAVSDLRHYVAGGTPDKWSVAGAVGANAEPAGNMYMYDVAGGIAVDPAKVLVGLTIEVTNGPNLWTIGYPEGEEVNIYAVAGNLVSLFTVGDMNDDGTIDNLDINPFVQALTDPAGYQTAFGLDPNDVGDINDDGVLDNLDINPFVALLTGPAAGTAVPEPASLALIGLGGLALLRRRR